METPLHSLWLAAALLCGGCVGTPPYPVSDHSDGYRFFDSAPEHSFLDEVRWLWEMETVAWPEWIDDPPAPPPLTRVTGPGIRVTYINHATLLIQMDGVNILTDPIWSDFAGPISWLGVPRVRAPGIAFGELPPIDIILISHDHYDHLDLPTLRRIARRDNPVVCAGLGLKALIESNGFDDVREFDWWKGESVKGLSISFVPAQHGSGRGLFDGNRTLWGGYVVNGNAGRVYFAGDTGYGGFISEIASRYAPVDVALLPIGSYEKRWFMKSRHMNPDDAVRAHMVLRSRKSVGMHFATFREHPEQAIDTHQTDLAAALARHRVAPDRFSVPGFGEYIEVHGEQ